MRKIALLSTWFHYRKRFAIFYFFFKQRNKGCVFSCGNFSGSIDVIEVNYRIGNSKPSSVILDEFGVGSLGPGIGTLTSSESSISKLCARTGVNELGSSLSAKLQHSKNTIFVKTPDLLNIFKTLFHSRVFS